MKKQVLLASALTLISLPSLASNFYVSGNIGQSKFTIDGFSGSESDTAFSLGAGYKFNETWAVEFNMRDFGAIKDSERENYGGGDYEEFSFKLAHEALELSVVGSYPFNDAASVYGRFGLGDLERKVSAKLTVVEDGDVVFSGSASESESKTKAMFGLGFSYNFTASVAASIEHNRYDDWDDLEIAFTTVGLAYQF